MKYLEGKTRKEIAEIEGVSENVIKESLEDAKKTNLFKQYVDRIMIGGKDEWKN